MATYYDFPTEVVVRSAHRLYLAKVIFEYPRPGDLNDPQRVLVFKITDATGDVVRLQNVPVTEDQWTGFITNFNALPGSTFEQKILNFGPTLIQGVPGGGAIVLES